MSQLQELQNQNAYLKKELGERQNAMAMRQYALQGTPEIANFESIRTAEGRAKTFINWPHPSYRRLRPDSLAAAGFFFSPAEQVPDRVTCVYCSVELAGWTDDDDPMSSHRVASSGCPFLTGYVKDTPSALPSEVGSMPLVEKPLAERQGTRWEVVGHVDDPSVVVTNTDNTNEMHVAQCCGIRQKTVVTVNGSIRALYVDDCYNARILCDAVLLGIHINNCRNIELVIGDDVPGIVIGNTTGCDITMCPDTMEGDIEARSSASIRIIAIPISSLPKPFRPQHLLASTAKNQVIIPDRMITSVKNGAIVTECKTQSAQ
mmetsp:Transcript_59630/g.122290  ORF Transcript_59630/g.122290 Transcript_59630/m.122290 type:complete len:318 (+) Transcript_59630:93-1046(+)